jgi:putative Ca2+/H+ antiporter (TMEM165/GDT1 family)
MDWHVFASVFAIVFLSEIPGKTTIAVIILASYAEGLPVFFGAAVAFAIHAAIAVAAGSAIRLLPATIAQAFAGAMFIAIGVIIWCSKPRPIDDSMPKAPMTPSRAFWTTFTIIFIAQWGDASQFAIAALQAKYRSTLSVLTASALALWVLSGAAIAMGRLLYQKLNPQLIQKPAALIFVALGSALLFRALHGY